MLNYIEKFSDYFWNIIKYYSLVIQDFYSKIFPINLRKFKKKLTKDTSLESKDQHFCQDWILIYQIILI